MSDDWKMISNHADRFSLGGQVALVLGGSSGIGREIALGFHEAGATVVPVGRTASKVAEVDAALAARGAKIKGYSVDVTDPEQLAHVIARTIAELGRIDVLVNSQGITILKPAESFTRADYDVLLATNLTSVFFACLETGKHMLERGSGCIVNIASLAAHRGFQLSALYTMSKHAVLGLTRTLAAEWAARGVRVNAISPGFFMTALNEGKMSTARKETALRRTPMHRFGKLEELVGAAIYLASPASSFVTGESIAVDGGFLAAGLD
ncbi:MAG: SDR family oxidoreductase [Hyphomicrobiales bacterium]|nr:SDR family oxidoreductase [Hyphomicrobiales bacterium]